MFNLKFPPKNILHIFLIATAFIATGIVAFERRKDPSTLSSLSIIGIKNAKLKTFFSEIKKHPDSLDDSFRKLGYLSPRDLDTGYRMAVAQYEYDAAVKFYEQGAENCYREGEDILTVALHTLRFNLAEELSHSDYPITPFHLNAVRSLINTDQRNWAYMYRQADHNQEGYKKYLRETKRLAHLMIEKYKMQNPVNLPRFPAAIDPKKEYEEIFGRENTRQQFENRLAKAAREPHSFESAKYGMQNTEILLNERGEKIGVLKNRNELLAFWMDKNHFAGVPPAADVVLPEKGPSVVQQWVDNSRVLNNTNLSDPANAEKLHRIRVLDIRLGNSDRHKENILAASETSLVPIDHDLLMHYIPGDYYWEAPYLNVSFSPSCQKYISEIRLEDDAAIMSSLGYTADDIRGMKMRSTVLKMAVEEGMPLKEIDMLFRFFGSDFSKSMKKVSSEASEEEIRSSLQSVFEEGKKTVSDPVEVWKLIGNNFEFYI